jgi:hypothetical protein
MTCVVRLQVAEVIRLLPIGRGGVGRFFAAQSPDQPAIGVKS